MPENPFSPKITRTKPFFEDTHKPVTFWIPLGTHTEYHQLQVITDRQFSKRIAAIIEEEIKKEKEKLGLG